MRRRDFLTGVAAIPLLPALASAKEPGNTVILTGLMPGRSYVEVYDYSKIDTAIPDISLKEALYVNPDEYVLRSFTSPVETLVVELEPGQTVSIAVFDWDAVTWWADDVTGGELRYEHIKDPAYANIQIQYL